MNKIGKPFAYAYWRKLNGYERRADNNFIKDGIIINCAKLELKYRAYYKSFYNNE